MRSTFATVLMFMFSITALFGQEAENKKIFIRISNLPK